MKVSLLAGAAALAIAAGPCWSQDLLFVPGEDPCAEWFGPA